MKSVDDHLRDILSLIEPIAPLELQLLDAHGTVGFEGPGLAS